MLDPADVPPSKRAAPGEINPTRKVARAVASVGQLENVAKVAEALQQDMKAVSKTLKGSKNKAVRYGTCPPPYHARNIITRLHSKIRKFKFSSLKRMCPCSLAGCRRAIQGWSTAQGVLAAGATKVKDEVQPSVAASVKGGWTAMQYVAKRRSTEGASILDHPRAWKKGDNAIAASHPARPAFADLSNFAASGPAGFVLPMEPGSTSASAAARPAKKPRVVKIKTPKRGPLHGAPIELPVPANGHHYTLFEYLRVWHGLTRNQRVPAEEKMVDWRYILVGTSTARRKYLIWTNNGCPSTLKEYLACDGVRSIDFDGWGRKTGPPALHTVPSSDARVSNLKAVRNSTTSKTTQDEANTIAKRNHLEDRGYVPTDGDVSISKSTNRKYYALTQTAPEAIIRNKAMQQTDAR